MPLTGLGSALRSVRERRGLTQRGLAQRAGLSDAAISKIENGRRLPDGSSLSHIMAALAIDLHELALVLDEVNGRVGSVPAPEFWSDASEERVRLFRALAAVTERLSSLERAGNGPRAGVRGQNSKEES